jgi:tetratricopeptide (TPR) repeat protein
MRFVLRAIALLAGCGMSLAHPGGNQDALRSKFQEGRQLIEQGKPAEALAVFESILKEDERARGSLSHAGYANLLLGRPAEALRHLDRFRALEPNHVTGLVWSIQAYQALGQTTQAEKLRAELAGLRHSSNPPKDIAGKLLFPRERISRPDGITIISDYFEPGNAPNLAYSADVLLGNGKLQRRLAVHYDPAATREAIAAGKLAGKAQIYFLEEYLATSGKGTERRIYRQAFERPTYEVARGWLLDAIAKTPEPIYIEKFHGRASASFPRTDPVTASEPRSSGGTPQVPEVPDLPASLRPNRTP